MLCCEVSGMLALAAWTTRVVRNTATRVAKSASASFALVDPESPFSTSNVRGSDKQQHYHAVMTPVMDCLRSGTNGEPGFVLLSWQQSSPPARKASIPCSACYTQPLLNPSGNLKPWARNVCSSATASTSMPLPVGLGRTKAKTPLATSVVVCRAHVSLPQPHAVDEPPQATGPAPSVHAVFSSSSRNTTSQPRGLSPATHLTRSPKNAPW